MRRQIVARKGGDRFFVFIDHHVNNKGKLCHFRSSKHVPMDRVSVQHACTGKRAVDKVGTVIAQYSDLIRNARQHTLSSTGKTGKEMWLDKAFRNQKICLHRYFVYHTGRSGRKRSDLDIPLRIPAVMHNDFTLLHDLTTDLFFQFFGICRPMKTGCHKKSHENVRVAFSQLPKHIGQDILAGNRSCVIRNNNDAILFSFCQFSQSRAVDRIFHRRSDDFISVFLSMQFSDARI